MSKTCQCRSITCLRSNDCGSSWSPPKSPSSEPPPSEPPPSEPPPGGNCIMAAFGAGFEQPPPAQLGTARCCWSCLAGSGWSRPAATCPLVVPACGWAATVGGSAGTWPGSTSAGESCVPWPVSPSQSRAVRTTVNVHPPVVASATGPPCSSPPPSPAAATGGGGSAAGSTAESIGDDRPSMTSGSSATARGPRAANSIRAMPATSSRLHRRGRRSCGGHMGVLGRVRSARVGLTAMAHLSTKGSDQWARLPDRHEPMTRPQASAEPAVPPGSLCSCVSIVVDPQCPPRDKAGGHRFTRRRRSYNPPTMPIGRRPCALFPALYKYLPTRQVIVKLLNSYTPGRGCREAGG